MRINARAHVRSACCEHSRATRSLYVRCASASGCRRAASRVCVHRKRARTFQIIIWAERYYNGNARIRITHKCGIRCRRRRRRRCRGDAVLFAWCVCVGVRFRRVLNLSPLPPPPRAGCGTTISKYAIYLKYLHRFIQFSMRARPRHPTSLASPPNNARTFVGRCDCIHNARTHTRGMCCLVIHWQYGTNRTRLYRPLGHWIEEMFLIMLF